MVYKQWPLDTMTFSEAWVAKPIGHCYVGGGNRCTSLGAIQKEEVFYNRRHQKRDSLCYSRAICVRRWKRLLRTRSSRKWENKRNGKEPSLSTVTTSSYSRHGLSIPPSFHLCFFLCSFYFFLPSFLFLPFSLNIIPCFCSSLTPAAVSCPLKAKHNDVRNVGW